MTDHSPLPPTDAPTGPPSQHPIGQQPPQPAQQLSAQPSEQPYALTLGQAYGQPAGQLAGQPAGPPFDAEVPAAPRRSFRDRWAPTEDLRAGAVVIGVLAVLGVLLGIVWQWWSPPGPIGYVVAPGAIQPDETEAFIAADGRFAVLVGAVGLIAGLLVWDRTRMRGPVAVVALAVGGVLGAVLTATVGHLLGGGSDAGKPDTLLAELPLSVHMHGLLLLEAGLAVLVYVVLASFAAADDLDRPDPDRPQDAKHPAVA